MKEEREEVIDIIDIGDTVLCDGCNDDYTDSDESGGILFNSSAYCPKCAPDIISSAKKYGEDKYIKDECGNNESFKEFVMRVRNGNNEIKITTWK